MSRKDGDYWRKSLEELKKNPVKQPIKKDYDVRRQRKQMEERRLRANLEELVANINAEQTRRKHLNDQLSMLRNEPIYEQHQSQMNAITQSISGLKEHLEKQVELKRKRRMFQKILGQYNSLKDVEDEIKKIDKDINRGVCKTLQEEKAMIKKINSLKKLKNSAMEFEEIESKINKIYEDPEYVQQQQVKDAQSAEMNKIKKKKIEVDESVKSVQEQLKEVWAAIKTMYDQKNELLTKCQMCSAEAKEVAEEYRAREKAYTRYHLDLMAAQDAVLREQRRQDRENQQAAEREALENATKMSRAEENLEERRRQDEANKEKQRATAAQKRSKAKEENQQQPSKPQKKKKAEPEKVVKVNNMVDVIIPYYKELTQLRACKGYLQGYMPTPSINPPTGRKKKRRKPKGNIKHNINWMQAFSEAGCPTLLPNRREQVEVCFKKVSELLDEMYAKSQAAKKEDEGDDDDDDEAEKPVEDKTTAEKEEQQSSPPEDNPEAKEDEPLPEVKDEEAKEES